MYDVLPLLLSNSISVDQQDGVDYLTCYLLNRSYEFVDIATPEVISSIHVDDFGATYKLGHTSNVSEFVRLYAHLSDPQLRIISGQHGVVVSTRSRKQAIRLGLLGHRCHSQCSGVGTVLLFKVLSRRRPMSKVLSLDPDEIARDVVALRQANVERDRARRKGESVDVRDGITAKNTEVRAVARSRLHDNDRDRIRTADSVARAAARREYSEEHRDQVREQKAHNRSVKQGRKNDDLAAAVEGARLNFPTIVDPSLTRSIISRWQTDMDPCQWLPVPCAVCGRSTRRAVISEIDPKDIDLDLLQNPCLPQHTLPTTYNLVAYNNAILCPAALRDRTAKGPMDVCLPCLAALKDGFQPLDSLANFQYYAHDELPATVKDAFNRSSMFDLMLVCQSRATRVTHLFSNKRGHNLYGTNPAVSQRYNAGNVAILAQDVSKVRTLLPPDRADIEEAMCALFVGTDTVPTRANIAKLSPVLVSKSRVAIIIDFLTSHNPWYMAAEVRFSPENMMDLFEPGETSDVAVPRGVEICCLTEDDTVDQTSYANRGDDASCLDNNELVMEAVGYTMGERDSRDYKVMKASALSWCLDRKRFLRMQSGSKFISDRDPGLLTYTFPQLDPWGIGSFYEPQRNKDQYITFERQLRNLLQRHDGIFQKDPNLAYVCWNIIQKKEVNCQTSFRTDSLTQEAIVKDIEEVGPAFADMISKWENDPYAKPSTGKEKKALRVLNKLRLVSKELRGSSGYKQSRRNEIRAMMKKMGTPALFMTINPADIADPLLGAIAGITPGDWEKMSSFERQKFVARNPGPAAQFFDAVITNFIRIILAYDPSSVGIGLFGRCSGYYGMVEAQGRGTLHCHMLVWLEGNPPPQDLRDRMAIDPVFKQKMFSWIETVIRCDLPGMTEPLKERKGEPAQKPDRPRQVRDPRLHKDPQIQDMDDGSFTEAFQEMVKLLAIECNWHEHKDTCWKHLKKGEPRTDSTCRMRIDGSTRSLTEVDPETGSILLKRLHPRINNFNDVILFLLRCNMDIKYIGSGEAAKALIYYVTDYITKATLPTHVALAAVEYAINRNDAKFSDITGQDVTPYMVRHSLFTKTVMALMARQELSHQQVMSYLIGGGDHYKSHTFQVLKWGDADRHIRSCEDEDMHRGDREGHEEPDSSSNIQPAMSATAPGMEGPVTRDGSFQEFPSVYDYDLDDIRGINELEEDGQCSDDEDHEDRTSFTAPSNEVSLRPDMCKGKIVVSDVVQDYILRSADMGFAEKSLWEYTESTVKITQSSEVKRKEHKSGDIRNTDTVPDHDELYDTGQDSSQLMVGDDGLDNSDGILSGEDIRAGSQVDVDNRVNLSGEPSSSNGSDGGPGSRRGRKPLMRGTYLPQHPHFSTHLVRLRSPVIVVLLGPTLPRPDRGLVEYDKWCRAILILFKPWRCLLDLKASGESWSSAFSRTVFPSNALEVIRNLNLENECKDARDEYNKQRRAGTVTSLIAGDDMHHASVGGDMDSLDVALGCDPLLDRGELVDSAIPKGKKRQYRSEEDNNELLLAVERTGVWQDTNSMSERFAGSATLVSDIDFHVIAAHGDLMTVMKKDKRPAPEPLYEKPPRKKRKQHEKSPTADLTVLGDERTDIDADNFAMERSPAEEVDSVIHETGIAGNDEQERAVRIIADHFVHGMETQLLMYVSGVGGTGKSHVVKAIVELFRRCNSSGQLLLSAPTGCAAVLINGYTIHALTFLPKTSWRTVREEELQAIWKDVKYLIIDEISMVSAKLLSEISYRMNQAKGPENTGRDCVFGGVNVIFFGDLGQLKPVRLRSVFSHELIGNLAPNIKETPKGQTALYGVFLWRLVDKVVELKKNWRARTDPKYVNLLHRVRQGIAWNGRSVMTNEQVGNGDNYTVSDNAILKSRQLQAMMPHERAQFRDAPIIVGTKVVRDVLNRRIARNFAKRTGATLYDYHSLDCFRKVPLPPDMQTRMWNVRSSVTKDSLGRIPLVPGMKVMVTENVAIKAHVVNGAEGVVRDIKYTTDPMGRRYAKCVYVYIEGSNISIPGLELGVVPILPVNTSFEYIAADGTCFTVSRSQVPLVPAYAYTDHKAQGRSLSKVIVDITSCRSLQGLYVMISRATSLNSIAVLRNFDETKIRKRLPQEFRQEFERIQSLDRLTKEAWVSRHEIVESQY